MAVEDKMNRRSFLLGAALASLAGHAHADSLTDAIVRALQNEGYTRIEIARTWLGRTRVLATSGSRRREIVFNPRTGEILRDLSDDDDYNALDIDDEDDDDDDDDSGQGRGRGRGGDDDDDGGGDDDGDGGDGDDGGGGGDD